MPPQALPNLYCAPSDVFDLLGAAGTQLRLDDSLDASGQRVVVTGADLAAGATSVPVVPLLFPLLRGSVLEFEGSGDAAAVEARLAAVAPTGSTALAVSPLPAALNAGSAARDSGVNLAAAARLAKGCAYGTERVKVHCCHKYQDADLATSRSANRWATAFGALWVCRRRGNPPPAAVKDEADEALQEMRAVSAGHLLLPDVGTRNPQWPFFSNVTVELRYDVAKVRVQQNISERSPTTYPQWPDWDSILFLDWLW